MSRSVHVSNRNKHRGSAVHKSRGGGGATDRPTSHAAATEAPPTPTPTLDVDSTDVDRAYIFSLAPRASRGRALGVASDARAHRSDGQIGFSRAAAGAVDRGDESSTRWTTRRARGDGSARGR